MPKFLQVFSIAVALGLSAPLMAQETATPEADSAATGDAGLSIGQEVAPAKPEAYIREKSGDWSLECIRTGQEEEPCQLFQPLFDASENQVANIRIFRLLDGGVAEAGALVAVPLETLLTGQLTIAIDANPPKRYPFSVCDRAGCYARLGLTSEDIAAYKRGAKATITLVPFAAPDQRVSLSMSLSGLYCRL